MVDQDGRFELPEKLSERIDVFAAPRAGGEFVLYWMRTAVRADENPALDVALTVANGLGLPVFVYHALSERYPFASDRHHRFVLEGARDVQSAQADRGIGYAFHLERPGHRGPHLRTLAEQAALIVTEDMPVEPLRSWTRQLANAVAAPLWRVDTACIVPMKVAGKAYDRAFAYRRATEKARAERVDREWPPVDPAHDAFVPELPFEPVDLQTADLSELIASCEIDHTVGPVPHTPGGTEAGYERWEAFKRSGLARYAADRNDPLRDGVSRMSAYLHYGHVSPFRLAREAHATPGTGPAKYLDELLVWRELAYTYCRYREDHDRFETLPGWAKQTLRDHARDPRPARFGPETLCRARTGDELWDAAQRSLLMHGELHNNVRMTWGKALLPWAPDPERALDRIVDLNHRYALDGRDPASYGGILWCLGQFDRPFPPEKPILGTLRPRPTEHHARRLNVERYAAHTSRALASEGTRVAVIGAGVSGLICARTLCDHGLQVAVFDKGGRPGGRLSTRPADGWTYDHGAQYFTVRDPRFRRYVDSWIEDGLVDEWTGRIVAFENGERRPVSGGTQRYVGVPEMNSIAAHLATDCDVRCRVLVRDLERRDDGWIVKHDDGEDGPFDRVVVAIPGPQALRLLGPAPGLAERVQTVRLNPCWAVLVAFADAVEVDFDGAFVNDGPLSWIARNGSKPGRASETWVLHAGPAWTRDHLDDPPESVGDRLIKAFAEVGGVELPGEIERQVHHWRYAIPAEPLPEPALFDDELGIGVCGDWCGGPRGGRAHPRPAD
jgi:photolyase PhrII